MHSLWGKWLVRGALIAMGVGAGWLLRPVVTARASVTRLSDAASAPVPPKPVSALVKDAATGGSAATGSTDSFDRLWKALTTDFKPGQETGYEHPVTVEQLETYLKLHGRDAESLVTAWQLTGDDALLAEAREKFPDDVRLLAATWKLGSEAEQVATLERWRKADAKNALAPAMLAGLAARKGDLAALRTLLADAAARPEFDFLRKAMRLSQREALLMAGKSPAEARVLAETHVSGAHDQPLTQLNKIARTVIEERVRAGELDAARELSAQFESIGTRWERGNDLEVDQLNGHSLQQVALQALPLDSLPADEREQIQRRLGPPSLLESLSDQAVSPHDILPRLTEHQAELYFQITEEKGAAAAKKWAAAVVQRATSSR